jgi:peptidoglycan/LPS O-acetylase OafA/YrhL
MNEEELAQPSADGPKTTAYSQQRIAGLDTLRSLAIVSVVCYHAFVFHGLGAMPAWLEAVFMQGWMGVDLFFVLSGFLIGTQFLRPYLAGQRPSLWHFYRDRIFRILPAYFAVLALYLFVPLWREFPQMAPAWTFLTMCENIVPEKAMTGSFSHAWSLCVEMHFYLCFPIVVLLAMRKPSLRKVVLPIAALLVFGMSIRAFFLFHSVLPLLRSHQSYGLAYMAYIYYPTYSHFEGLVAGVVLALLLSFRPRVWNELTRRGTRCLLAGVALVGISAWLYTDRWTPATAGAAAGVIIGPLTLSLGLGLLVLASLAHTGVATWLKIPGTRAVAVLAYTLYLTHKELLHLVDRAFPALFLWNRFAWMAAYALCCTACSTALYWSVERPFLRLRSRFRRAA